MTSRRSFLRTLGASASGAFIAPGILGAMGGCMPRTNAYVLSNDESGWDRVPGILRRIVPPRFPARDFDITSYGARGDGTTECSAAFRSAIGACNAAGGGRVVVPAGRFLTGPIHLRSNVNLHVQDGATILFSRDPRAYLPAVFTRWEGTEMMGYSPFIYAFEQENIAISGAGTLDGQSDDANWWPWKGGKQAPARNQLMKAGEDEVPVANRLFADGSFLRPQFIQTYRCRNVLIEDVHIVNSPMWEIHPVLSTNVTVRRVKIRSHGPNNDGCDPESCRDVLIEGCEFDTGDDCIAIKSGRNADGRRLHAPTANVVIRNCVMKDGHGGVTIGSEISGDVRWVFAEKCRMDSPNLDRALRLKTNAMRGGALEHIFMRDCTVGQVADAVVHVDFNYEEGAKGAFLPVVRDINVERVSSRKSKHALFLRAFPNAPITDVRLSDCQFNDVANPSVLENVRGLTYDRVTINGKPA
ncbi:MAG: glycoside hydrolase family 28 [Gemmatimonadetes bacterium]|nr:glycoside hydrolase family 28 [Gemmatimonadota bacterium]